MNYVTDNRRLLLERAAKFSRININKVRSNAGKITSALVSLGFYDFTITQLDEYIEINIVYLSQSPYNYIRVYQDVVYYVGEFTFEGMAYTKSTIIKDILGKE